MKHQFNWMKTSTLFALILVLCAPFAAAQDSNTPEQKLAILQHQLEESERSLTKLNTWTACQVDVRHKVEGLERTIGWLNYALRSQRELSDLQLQMERELHRGELAKLREELAAAKAATPTAIQHVNVAAPAETAPVTTTETPPPPTTADTSSLTDLPLGWIGGGLVLVLLLVLAFWKKDRIRAWWAQRQVERELKDHFRSMKSHRNQVLQMKGEMSQRFTALDQEATRLRNLVPAPAAADPQMVAKEAAAAAAEQLRNHYEGKHDIVVARATAIEAALTVAETDSQSLAVVKRQAAAARFAHDEAKQAYEEAKQL